MRPLQWLRALGCVDAKPAQGPQSAYCKGFTPAAADGIAYHPHTALNGPTDRSTRTPMTPGSPDIPKLLKTIDGIQKAGGLKNGTSSTKKFDLDFTEFGYQTNPPDPLLGVTVAQQNAWLQQSDYLGVEAAARQDADPVPLAR